jgi:hypothetical protein
MQVEKGKKRRKKKGKKETWKGALEWKISFGRRVGKTWYRGDWKGP